MFELKPLSREAIPAALTKAERYRLLNEPTEAESICLDVLNIDPDNQDALVTLLLALSDQLRHDHAERMSRAREVLHRLHSAYQRAYYAGLICERRAKAVFEHDAPGSGAAAYEWLVEAMSWYEKAENIHPPGNDDAVLRWNTCARLLAGHPELRPREEEAFEPQFLE
jgi:hypothetical protein